MRDFSQDSVQPKKTRSIGGVLGWSEKSHEKLTNRWGCYNDAKDSVPWGCLEIRKPLDLEHTLGK